MSVSGSRPAIGRRRGSRRAERPVTSFVTADGVRARDDDVILPEKAARAHVMRASMATAERAVVSMRAESEKRKAVRAFSMIRVSSDGAGAAHRANGRVVSR